MYFQYSAIVVWQLITFSVCTCPLLSTAIHRTNPGVPKQSSIGSVCPYRPKDVDQFHFVTSGALRMRILWPCILSRWVAVESTESFKGDKYVNTGMIVNSCSNDFPFVQKDPQEVWWLLDSELEELVNAQGRIKVHCFYFICNCNYSMSGVSQLHILNLTFSIYTSTP